MRKFTREARFECGLDEIVAGKKWAFTAVVGQHHPAALGVAVEDEPGYHPIPEGWAHSDSFDEMQAHADELNTAEGLSVNDATRIVVSSMAAGPLA